MIRRHTCMRPRSTVVLAAALLAPLVSGCGGRESDSTTAGANATATATATPAEPSGAVPAEQAHSSLAAVVSPSYEDAERAFHGGRYEEAASMFEAYTSANPDNAWGQYMLGLSAWKSGDRTRALEGFDAALRLEPGHRKSLFNSARVLLETSRPREALERVQQALASEPLSGEGYRLLGRARHELGQMDEAIGAYRRAIAIDDHDTWAMNNLGYLYIEQGCSDAALLPLARAVELRPQVPVFQNNFGTALERSGHVLAARQAYQSALQADSTYTKASVALERVNGRLAESDTASVDVAALSREFQSQVEQWRGQTASASLSDSSVIDTTVVTDSTSVSATVGDTVTH